MSQIARRAFFGFAAAAPFAAASAIATAIKPQAKAVVTFTLDPDCFSSAFEAAMEKRDREIMDRLWGALRVPSVRWADVEIGAEGAPNDELSSTAGAGLNFGIIDKGELSAPDEIETLLNCEFPNLRRIGFADGDKRIEEHADHSLTGDAITQVGSGDSVLFRKHVSISVGSVGTTNVARGGREHA